MVSNENEKSLMLKSCCFPRVVGRNDTGLPWWHPMQFPRAMFVSMYWVRAPLKAFHRRRDGKERADPLFSAIGLLTLFGGVSRRGPRIPSLKSEATHML